MKSTNYKATILHKSADNKFIVIGTEDGELFAFDLIDELKQKVKPEQYSNVVPVYKQIGNPFTAGKSAFTDSMFDTEEVRLELFGLSVKAPLFRLGWSKLKKIWLISDEVL